MLLNRTHTKLNLTPFITRHFKSSTNAVNLNGTSCKRLLNRQRVSTHWSIPAPTKHNYYFYTPLYCLFSYQTKRRDWKGKIEKTRLVAYDWGAQTWTLKRPSATRASTRDVRPGDSIPSPFVTKTIGFSQSFTTLLSKLLAEEDNVEEATAFAWSSLELILSSTPSFRLIRTCWRFEIREGGKKLFFTEVVII